MTVGTKLLSGLKKMRSASVSVTGQRLQSAVVQHVAADHLDTGLEYVESAKPYSAVPGPRQLPFIGNAWRFLPYIGKCGVFF
jgi:cytochrome P450 family 49 subfamily A